MKTISTKWYAVAGLVAAVIIFSAWRPEGSQETKAQYAGYYDDEDTTAPRKKYHGKRDYKIGDLDEAMRDLDKAMADMDRNFKIDFGKMDKEMKQAMEELKKIDFEKIGREVEASLKEINWEKTRVEVDKALREAETKIRNVDMKKVKEEIEAAKKHIDAEKIRSHIDMDKIKKSVDEGLSKARVGLELAKKELTLLKEFTEGLEKDGLIDKKKGFTLEIKNRELYINGTKQSKEVNDKYRKYFKDEDYTIRSDGDDVYHL